jgi:hypothetical protein
MREIVRTFTQWFFQRKNERQLLQEMLILGILRDDGLSDEASIRRHLKRFTQNGFSKCVSVELPLMEQAGLIERIPCIVGGASEKWRITPMGIARHEKWKTRGRH